MSTPSREAPYEVHWSRAIKQVLRQLHQQAVAGGIEEQFLYAMRTLVERLRSDPLGFGEPCYQLQQLKLEVRSGIIAPLFVSFGVQKDKHLVFVKEVQLLPGSTP
jgi:hypothetical protein